MKTIRSIDVSEVPACEVKPGMITLDGVVISVTTEQPVGRRKAVTSIEHRSTIYVEDADKPIQVYGRLLDFMVQAVLQDLAESHA